MSVWKFKLSELVYKLSSHQLKLQTSTWICLMPIEVMEPFPLPTYHSLWVHRGHGLRFLFHISVAESLCENFEIGNLFSSLTDSIRNAEVVETQVARCIHWSQYIQLWTQLNLRASLSYPAHSMIASNTTSFSLALFHIDELSLGSQTSELCSIKAPQFMNAPHGIPSATLNEITIKFNILSTKPRGNPDGDQSRARPQSSVSYVDTLARAFIDTRTSSIQDCQLPKYTASTMRSLIAQQRTIGELELSRMSHPTQATSSDIPHDAILALVDMAFRRVISGTSMNSLHPAIIPPRHCPFEPKLSEVAPSIFSPGYDKVRSISITSYTAH